ncbi:MAG: hypothetical protein M1827_004281 [Pycnora praestabilis]|nr:MAG: hypothetical protein M1827_004281 [Pycnora praestabilis]
MEAVVFNDSPLADYLEGEGEGRTVGNRIRLDEEPSPSSFAPRGLPVIQPRFRGKIPRPLSVNIRQPRTVAIIHESCSRAVNSRIGRADNERFLEQFRYIIVASQLLNERVDEPHYNGGGPQGLADPATPSSLGGDPVGLTGVVATSIGAFSFVWILRWASERSQGRVSGQRLCIGLAIFALGAILTYSYARRRWLLHMRGLALHSASSLVAAAQGYEAATATAVNFIQEVELVSRGYRLSTPLPPITRLEENSQSRRCTRLRRTLHMSLAAIMPPHIHAFNVLQPLADEMNLEKYYDVYDISTSDLQEAAAGYSESEFDDMETLKALKTLLYRLHVIRKIVMCSLLALDADGARPDFARWTSAVNEMQLLRPLIEDHGDKLRRILKEEEHFPIPPSPKAPLTPGKERVRQQLRKLGSLAQGIRGLQAKLHLLREESDRTLDESEDATELGPNLMAQYDSIGADLRALMQEWESGKAALTQNIIKSHERRKSRSSNGFLSPTSSLSGSTAFDGSPVDPLRVLNGDEKSTSSMEISGGSDDEIFEAIAISRQRSTLSREERIVKMREDRVRRASLKGKADANTHMLRELETVINLRPRGRTTGRITSM